MQIDGFSQSVIIFLFNIYLAQNFIHSSHIVALDCNHVWLHKKQVTSLQPKKMHIEEKETSSLQKSFTMQWSTSQQCNNKHLPGIINLLHYINYTSMVHEKCRHIKKIIYKIRMLFQVEVHSFVIQLNVGNFDCKIFEIYVALCFYRMIHDGRGSIIKLVILNI